MGLLASLMLVGLFLISSNESKEKCEKEGLLGGEFFSPDKCNAKPEKSFQEIVLVIGATQNTPKPTLSDNVKKYIKNSLVKYEDARISTILVSEAYRNPDELWYDKDKKATSTIDQYIKDLNNKVLNIDREIGELKAIEDGADYLEAIRTAASSIDGKVNACIVVIGSGLSDKGLLNFASDDLLNESVKQEKIINGVNAKINNSRELDGVKVVWDGIGATVLPQLPLSPDEKDKIKDVYGAILRRMGARDVEFEQKLNGRASVDTESKVLTTKTYNPKIDITEYFDDTTSVSFNGNEATFVNKTEAERTLLEHVKVMLDHKDTKAEITTFMARGQVDCSEGTRDDRLLADRGKAVKDFFIANGVAGDRIKTSQGGFGSENECPYGEYMEEQAKKNRKVVIHIFN